MGVGERSGSSREEGGGGAARLHRSDNGGGAGGKHDSGRKGDVSESRVTPSSSPLRATFVFLPETPEASGWRGAGREREDGKDEGKSMPWQA